MMAWPTEWNVKYPSLTSINIPILSNATYGITLRDLNNKKATFSVSAMWECIRPRNIEVSWFHVVWFSHQIPRHDILLWLVVKRKLKTQDLLRQWDVSNSTKLNLPICLLCEAQPDSHDHLFFECRFSSWIWERVKGVTGIPNLPSTLNAIVDFLTPFG
ncbi:reverse transcriptase domain, reverse transcriptase zinc-binding domain protein [Tanacetum coccineum]